MSTVPYCRKQLAFILKAVRERNTGAALEAISRLSDGLDHVEAALRASEASESGVGGQNPLLEPLKALLVHCSRDGHHRTVADLGAEWAAALVPIHQAAQRALLEELSR